MVVKRNEEAVSPVIGVILMIAITVILAAVIAAFIFGMAGNIQQTKIVAATAVHSGSSIIVTWQGGQDNALVQNYTINLNNGAQTSGLCINTVGNSTQYGTSTPGTQNHVVVTAIFNDGSQQVILDSYV